MVSEDAWSEIVYRREPLWYRKPVPFPVDLLSRVRHLRAVVCGIRSDDLVFVGNISDAAFKWLLRSVTSDNVFVLDDGMATVSYLLNLADKKRFTFPTKRQVATAVIATVREPDISRITFFSIYKGIAAEGVSFLENSLSHLRSQTQQNPIERTNTFAFVGQPLAELHIISRERYVEIVEAVRARAHKVSAGFTYYAHRGENLEALPASWNAAYSSTPIEHELLRVGKLPREIYTFYSTAAYSLGLIHGSKVKCTAIQLPDECVHRSSRNQVKRIWQYLAGLEHVHVSSLRELGVSEDPRSQYRG
jgi:hypothetical protein